MMNKQAINSAAFEKNILNLLKKNKFSGYKTHHGMGGAGLGGLIGAGVGAIDAATDKDAENLSSDEKMQRYLKKMLSYGGTGAAVGGGLGALKGRKIRNALAEKELGRISPAVREALEKANSLPTPHAREAARNEIKRRVHEAVPSVSPEEYESAGRNIFKENKVNKAEEREAMRQQRDTREAQKGTFVDGHYVDPGVSNSRNFKSSVRQGVQNMRDMTQHVSDFVSGEGKVKAKARKANAHAADIAKDWENRGIGAKVPSYQSQPSVDHYATSLDNAKKELDLHNKLLASDRSNPVHKENVIAAHQKLQNLAAEGKKHDDYLRTGDPRHLQPTPVDPPINPSSRLPFDEHINQTHQELANLNQAAIDSPGDMSVDLHRKVVQKRLQDLIAAQDQHINLHQKVHKVVNPPFIGGSPDTIIASAAPSPIKPPDPAQAHADYMAGVGQSAPRVGGPPVDVSVPATSASVPIGMNNLAALNITPQSLI